MRRSLQNIAAIGALVLALAASLLAQEQATREHTPAARVVRSAQFHDIARQAIGWGRSDDRTTTTVPEPGSMILVGTGLFGLAVRLRQKKNAA